MANPQIENGFVRISNDIYDALYKIRMPGESRQLFDFIIRKTYGYNRKEALLTLDEFRITGISDKGNITRGIKKLKEMRLIIVRKKDNKSDCFYSIQKDYDLWEPLAKKPKTIVKKDNESLSKKTKTIVKKDNESLSKKTKAIVENDNIVKNDNEIGVNGEYENVCDFENEENGKFENNGAFVKNDNNLCQKRQNSLSKTTTTINKKQLKDKLKTLESNKFISNPNKSINKSAGKARSKKLFFSFVYLTDEQYAELCRGFGKEEADRRIKRLDDYIAMKGVKYKDHYRTIIVWYNNDFDKQEQEEKRQQLIKNRQAF